MAPAAPGSIPMKRISVLEQTPRAASCFGGDCYARPKPAADQIGRGSTDLHAQALMILCRSDLTLRVALRVSTTSGAAATSASQSMPSWSVTMRARS